MITMSCKLRNSNLTSSKDKKAVQSNKCSKNSANDEI